MPPIPFDLQTPTGLSDAVQRLQAGEIIALPTDTVPGLAILSNQPNAALRLAQMKGSDLKRPFSLHFPDLTTVAKWTPQLPPGLASWMSQHLTSGLTVVLPSNWINFPSDEEWAWPNAGIRLPQDSGFQQIARQLNAPLLMTSINTSGCSTLHGVALREWLKEKQISACSNLGMESKGTASSVYSFSPLMKVVRKGASMPMDLPGKKVLVLCSGNICRSPVAEVLLRASVARAWQIDPHDLEALGWVFASAGTFAMSDGAASEHSIAVAAEIGLDLSRHRSQHVDEALQQPWDLILGMGPNHLGAFNQSEHVDLFDPTGEPVPDPFGGGPRDYQVMCSHLIRAVEQRIQLWSAWPAP